MVFKKILRAFGVGGPSVDTVLDTPTVMPGQALTGQVHIHGGDHDVMIEHVALGLVTRVESEGGDGEYHSDVEFHRLVVCGGFPLRTGENRSIPFTLDVPWETPITAVYGQHLHGMTMGVRTELAVAKAVDKGDLDPVDIQPLPAQVAVLDAVAGLGFRFKSADLERGHIRGSHQTMPFYQEIEFAAAPQYAHALNELELTLVASPHGVDVILEVDKRGGLFGGGHDVYHHFQVPAYGAEHTDWAAAIDAWLNQSVLAHAGHHGYGHHGDHGHGGFGAGAMAAGVGAGLVGGYLAAETMDEVSDAVEDFGDFGFGFGDDE
jgi:sporulation-control protein